MKLHRILILTIAGLFTAGVSAHASLLLTMYDAGDNPTGAITAAPDSTVGWGIKIVNADQSYWAQLTGSTFTFTGGIDLRTTPTTEAYTDFVGPLGLELAPGGSTTIMSYNQGFGTGAGSIVIGNFASGLTMYGNINVTYDYFNLSRNDQNFDPEFNYISSGKLDPALASVTTADLVVPEPSTWVLPTTAPAL